MKLIPLTQGQFAKVDDGMYDALSQYRWHALKTRAGFVASRMEGKKPFRRRVYMHRQVLPVINGLMVDHINHDTLDNQSHNLRPATNIQNRHNSRANNESKTSKFLGVSYDKRDKVFVAQLSVNGKPKKVGRSKDEDDAAAMYNSAAKKYYGEFANLNKINR